MKIPILIALTLFMPISTLLANPADLAWEAYLAGDFDSVEFIVSSSISDSALTFQDQARLYLALGCSDAMQGRDRTASAAFEQSLLLDPENKLTAADIPPPVWRLYQPVLKRLTTDSRSTIINLPEESQTNLNSAQRDTVVKYIGVAHSSPAIVKSLVFPGWGHYTEERGRWKLFASAELLLVAGWVVMWDQSSRAHDSYISETNPTKMSDAYDKYNQMYRLTWGVGVAALANYFIAQWDFFSAPPPVELGIKQSPTNGLMLGLNITW